MDRYSTIRLYYSIFYSFTKEKRGNVTKQQIFKFELLINIPLTCHHITIEFHDEMSFNYSNLIVCSIFCLKLKNRDLVFVYRKLNKLAIGLFYLHFRFWIKLFGFT